MQEDKDDAVEIIPFNLDMGQYMDLRAIPEEEEVDDTPKVFPAAESADFLDLVPNEPDDPELPVSVEKVPTLPSLPAIGLPAS